MGFRKNKFKVCSYITKSLGGTRSNLTIKSRGESELSQTFKMGFFVEIIVSLQLLVKKYHFLLLCFLCWISYLFSLVLWKGPNWTFASKQFLLKLRKNENEKLLGKLLVEWLVVVLQFYLLKFCDTFLGYTF